MLLPEDLVKKGLEIAKNARFMGYEFEAFSREELIAIAGLGWWADHTSREEARKEREFLFDCMRPK